MNENEFELDGKVYSAVSVADDDWTCIGCQLGDKYGCFAPDYVKCMNDDRKDGKNVIFTDKPQ